MELNDPHFGKVLKPDDGDTDQGRRVRLLERLGVNPNEAVVVYGNTLDMPAARVCWFLRFLGVDASVLDGGRAAWLGINGPMDEHEGDVAETSIETVTPRQGFYLSVTDVAEQLEDPATRLIDLREPDEIEQGPFRGLEIPGATRIPRSAFAERWGSVRSAAELEQILDAARIDRVTRLILIGPTGLDAAISWLALSLLGVDSVIITDGGWHEWVETPGLPLGAAASRSPALFHRTA